MVELTHYYGGYEDILAGKSPRPKVRVHANTHYTSAPTTPNPLLLPRERSQSAPADSDAIGVFNSIMLLHVFFCCFHSFLIM